MVLKLCRFPPVLHEWFVEMFPETGAWFVARLKYTRSCAVMSMVGYVLGYGETSYLSTGKSPNPNVIIA